MRFARTGSWPARRVGRTSRQPARRSVRHDTTSMRNRASGHDPGHQQPDHSATLRAAAGRDLLTRSGTRIGPGPVHGAASTTDPTSHSHQARRNVLQPGGRRSQRPRPGSPQPSQGTGPPARRNLRHNANPSLVAPVLFLTNRTSAASKVHDSTNSSTSRR